MKHALEEVLRECGGGDQQIGSMVADGNLDMILFLRDFDQPPFLPEWWEDPFDPTFFGLGYRFERISR